MTSASELQAQGIDQFQKKQYGEAGALFQQAQIAYDSAGQPDLAAEMRVNRGLALRAQGEYAQALDEMSQAYEVFAVMGDQKRMAMTLGNMGAAYKALGDKEQAARSYREAADLFQELGETAMHGETLLAIAELQMSDRQVSAAAATYEAGLSEIDELNASQKVLKNLMGLRNRLMGGE